MAVTIRLGKLSRQYHLSLDYQEIDATLNSIGVTDTDITGVCTLQKDGELVEVWATDSSMPYSIHAIYTQLK